MPVGTAPGNRPDLIAEFRNFVIVIEVTLSESSRQEAMEGEPVRRHVADAVEKYSKQGKPVFGLFIAKILIQTLLRHFESVFGIIKKIKNLS